MTQQLSMLTGGPGWYSCNASNRAGEGGGHCRYYDTEDDAVNSLGSRAHDKKFTVKVDLLDRPPVYALERERLWEAATILADDERRIITDGWWHWIGDERVSTSDVVELAGLDLVEADAEFEKTLTGGKA